MAVATLTQTFDRVILALPPSKVVQPIALGATSSWRAALPVLKGSRVQLRDLRLSDAAALLGSLTSREVTRFISPPPTTVAGFERFIEWARSQRAAGEYACFAVVPTGSDEPVGIIQVRKLNGSFETAEWGFAVAPAFWGTGLFIEAARLVLAFCFRTIGVRRLEARAATVNGRGNGAIRKLGASCDAVLKRSFQRDGRYFDQFLWSIGREDWDMSQA